MGPTLQVHRMDVKSAFLNGDLIEDIDMEGLNIILVIDWEDEERILGHYKSRN